MQLKDIITEWKQNINRLPEIGIDDWAAYCNEVPVWATTD